MAVRASPNRTACITLTLVCLQWEATCLLPRISCSTIFGAIASRAGRDPVVRIGGNTQDTTTYNVSYAGILKKSGGGYTESGTPITPQLEYSNIIFKLIHNIADAVDARIV